MRVTYKHKNYVVLDDFLPPAQFKRLNKYFRKEAPFEHLGSEPGAAWTINDGRPFATPIIVFDVDKKGTALPSKRPEGVDYFTYPSDCAIDPLIAHIAGAARSYQDVVGKPGVHWKSSGARAFSYPLGTGVEWHYDAAVVGAYIYYAHTTWKPRWGGELLVGNDDENDAGTYLMPAPNRIVILRGGTPHKVAKVSVLSGENFRYSVAGFFRKNMIATYSR